MGKRFTATLAAVQLSAATRPLVWRWVVGALVVLAAAVGISAWIDDSTTGEWWALSIEQICALWPAAFAAGCIIGRWRAVLLALLPILVAIPFGERDNDGFPPSQVVEYMAWISVIGAPFIVAGVIAAQLIRRHRSAPAPG
jgi:hypothetical protein